MDWEERRAQMIRRARELAETGRFLNFDEIEAALEQEGHPRAGDMLDTTALRIELVDLCERARKGRLSG